MRRILHIVADLHPCNGIAAAVSNLAHEQAIENKVTILISRWNFAWELLRSVSAADVVHVHGAWTFPVWLSGWAALLRKRTLVYSPHGSFSPLALQRSKCRKAISSVLFERNFLHRATVLHVTSEQEKRNVLAYAHERSSSTVRVIPWGIKEFAVSGTRCARGPFVLFMGRLSALKGVGLLLEAWAVLAERFPEWRLVVVGHDEEGFLSTCQAQTRRVEFLPPQYGEAKDKLLLSAGVLVLPSLSENFGLVVGEALACATPVVTTEVGPWGAVAEQGCGWVVEPTVESLVAGLTRAMNTSVGERDTMGQRGQAWVHAEYNWGHVARQMSDLYCEAIRDGKQ